MGAGFWVQWILDFHFQILCPSNNCVLLNETTRVLLFVIYKIYKIIFDESIKADACKS